MGRGGGRGGEEERVPDSKHGTANLCIRRNQIAATKVQCIATSKDDLYLGNEVLLEMH